MSYADPGHFLGKSTLDDPKYFSGTPRASSMVKKYVSAGNVFIKGKYVGREFYKPKNLLDRWVVGGEGLPVIS